MRSKVSLKSKFISQRDCSSITAQNGFQGSVFVLVDIERTPQGGQGGGSGWGGGGAVGRGGLEEERNNGKNVHCTCIQISVNSKIQLDGV